MIAPPVVHEVLRSPGQPLDRATRDFFEPRFGQDFSQVRVHTDARAAESAFAVNALAYTVGHNVVFGAGRYAPESPQGRKLLAHELTHTLQHGNTVGTTEPLPISPPESAEEQEATRNSSSVGTETKQIITQHRSRSLARQPAPSNDPNAERLQRADQLRISNLSKAIYEVRQVEIALEEQASIDQIWRLFAPTLWSLMLWLKVTPDDAEFGPTVHQALEYMRTNRSWSTEFFQIPDDVSTCGVNSVVLGFARSPDVFVCDRAFNHSDLCLANILTHEIFHLMGLTHTSDFSPAGFDTCASLGRDEALTNPYCMTDLVFQVSGGPANTSTVICS